MLRPIYKKKFEKDLKRAQKRGLNLSKIKALVNELVQQKPLIKNSWTML